MKPVSVKFVVGLVFVVAVTLAGAAEQKTKHSGESGSARPEGAKTTSDGSYQQVRSVADRGEDLHLSLPSGEKVKVSGTDLSEKLSKALNKVEDTHKRISTDCKTKRGGKQLDTLLQGFVDAIAQELDEATRKSDGGGLINDKKQEGRKDPAIFNVDRLSNIESGIRQILETQQKTAKDPNEADRSKQQASGLLSWLDKIVSVFHGKPSQDSKNLSEIAADGTPVKSKGDSIQKLVDEADKDKSDVCWFDSNNADDSKPSNGNASQQPGNATADAQAQPQPQAPLRPTAPPPAGSPTDANKALTDALLRGLDGRDGKDSEKDKPKEEDVNTPPSSSPTALPMLPQSGKSSQQPQSGQPQQAPQPQSKTDDKKDNPAQNPMMMPPMQNQDKGAPPMPSSSSQPQASTNPQTSPGSDNPVKPSENNQRNEPSNQLSPPTPSSPLSSPSSTLMLGPGGVPVSPMSMPMSPPFGAPPPTFGAPGYAPGGVAPLQNVNQLGQVSAPR